MSLNSWLCKKFDSDNKGYVTIYDIVWYILVNAISEKNFTRIIIIIFLPLMTGLLNYSTRIPSNGEFSDLKVIAGADSLIGVIFISWLWGILFWVSICATIFIIYYILKLKVAKCPLKNERGE